MSTTIESFAYGRDVTTGLTFENAVDAAKAFLKDEGFGVLCEIDVQATLREKLGVTFRPYRILGSCNPTLAHRALTAEPQIGLLLPCNLVVQEIDGTTHVSAIDANAMLGVAGAGSELSPVASDANERLGRVLERLSTQPAS
ncbi:MAG TPA: DUF302 domain-containing protein [Candidatus Baltobacteraceae bacterium]|jgi:uncharacterized protein (DUF302 family)